MPVAKMNEALIRMNAETFAAGNVDAAYHVLAAAVHLADNLSDAVRLKHTASIAAAQGNQLNIERHRLSADRARSRSNESLFTSLAGTIRSMQVKMANKAMIERINDRRSVR